jgi:hypothetical protein
MNLDMKPVPLYTMDLQCQSPARPSLHDTYTTDTAKPVRKNVIAVSVLESGSVPQPGVDNDQRESLRESVRQSLFQTKSNKALKLPNGYLKVAVLIIRWDKSIDDFEGHTEEVSLKEDTIWTGIGLRVLAD